MHAFRFLLLLVSGLLSVCAAAAERFVAAEPVWPATLLEETNVLVRFTTLFESVPSSRAVLRVTGSNVYRIRLNGHYIGYGPARGPKGCFRVDEWPLDREIGSGENRLEIDVASYNCYNYYLMRQPPFLQAEVVSDGKVLVRTKSESGDFTAVRLPRVQKVTRYSIQRTFCEAYCLGLRTPSEPLPLVRTPSVRYLDRIVPYPDFRLHELPTSVSIAEVAIDPSRPIVRRPLLENGSDSTRQRFAVGELEVDLRRTVQQLKFSDRRPVDSKKDKRLQAGRAVRFEADVDRCGFIGLTVTVGGPARVLLLFDDRLIDGEIDPMRYSCCNAVEWRFESAGTYVVETFEPYTMKVADVCCLEGGCEVRDFHIRDYTCPNADRASYQSSDPALNRIFAAARESFAQNAVDVLTDCAGRERGGYLCDSFFSARAAHLFTGETKLERLFLENYAIPDSFDFLPRNMVPMCYPADHPDGVFIPNWAMWLILETEEYLARSGDRRLVERLKKRLFDIVTYFDDYVNGDGLLEGLPGVVFVDGSDANKMTGGVSYPSNMLWAQALDALSRLYGRPEFAKRAAAIRNAVLEQSWNGTWFRDHALREPNGKLMPVEAFSEACQYYAFLCGVATSETHSELWRKLVTDFGHQREKAQLHPEVAETDCFVGRQLRLELLVQAGLSKQVIADIKGYYADMATKTGTLWEYKNGRHSLSHGLQGNIGVLLSKTKVPNKCAEPEIIQIFRPERMTLGNTNVKPLQPIDEAAWIWEPNEPNWSLDATDDWSVNPKGSPSIFRRFRCEFESDGTPFEFDISADERFVLLLDGAVIARGPHRGSVAHWYYETYAVKGLTVGPHRMEAVVTCLGVHAPIAQLSWRGGLVLKASGAYDSKLTTGKAPWRTVRLVNTTMTDRGTSGSFGAGSQCEVTGTSFLNETPLTGWREAVVVRPPVKPNPYGGRVKGWRLFPSICPDQIARRQTPGHIVNVDCDLTQRWTVPPKSEVDLWWDLENYYCAYPELRVAGGKGSVVSWGWTESLTDEKGDKGNRAEWKGKSFNRLMADTFRCDGRADAFFTSPWWRCGRWCRLTVRTADEPLTIESISIVETHYPLAFDASFESDDPLLDSIGTICRRSLEMCAHEMTVDCPYYEQQMYPGDSRVQLAVLSALTRDDRLARTVMTTFDMDRRSDGFVAMNFPSRGTQESATYTMCWILMFGDYLRWHDNAMFLKNRMPGVRNALMGLALYENSEGLVQSLPGWCFVDWVSGWSSPTLHPGSAPGSGPQGASAIENLFYLLCLRTAADIEIALGETQLADHWRSKANRLGAAIRTWFWKAERGAMADTVDGSSFSEHAQALAILSGILTEEEIASSAHMIVDRKDIHLATSYFTYYVFEALARAGRADEIRRRFSVWKNYLDWGARTTLETTDSRSRSDCHAWSAYPIYFYNTTFAGVRPASSFFRTVCVSPQPAGLDVIRARTPSPKGMIETNFRFLNGGITGTITLPPGLTGEFVWKGTSLPLKSAQTNVIDL